MSEATGEKINTETSFTVSIDTTLRFVLLLAVFTISMVVGALYTGGDQLTYTKVYDQIGPMDLVEAFTFYTFWLTSVEIIHFLVIWLASSYIPKIFLFSLINTFFSYLVIRVFDIHKVHFLVTSTFLLTNFYMYVLFFAAERLKFGFILLALGLCIQSHKKLKYTAFFLSITAHFQMLVVILPKLFQMTFRSIIYTLKSGRFKKAVLLIFIPLIFILLVAPNILLKVESYSNSSREITTFIPMLLVFILSLFYVPKYTDLVDILLIFFPLFIAVYIIGGDRVNMIGYMYFLSYALKYNHGINIGILITGIYFLGKNVIFLTNVIQMGRGF